MIPTVCKASEESHKAVWCILASAVLVGIVFSLIASHIDHISRERQIEEIKMAIEESIHVRVRAELEASQGQQLDKFMQANPSLNNPEDDPQL